MENSDQGTPLNSRPVISPTTSTPGLSPGGRLSTPTRLRSSELLESDESIVDTPREKVTSPTIDTTNESTMYERHEDDTTITDTSNNSCIALRTRSRDMIREIIKFNISKLQTSMTRGIDQQDLETSGELEITTSRAMDSLTLPRYKPNPEENKRILETLSNLDTSLETMSFLDEKFDKDMELDKYAKKAVLLIERGKKIVIPEEFSQKTEEIDREGQKHITFLVDRPRYESALAEVIKALELLSKIDLSCIPTKNLENIINILLAICTDCNSKIQSLHDTMAIMVRYIQEFMILGYKADTLDSYKLKLEGDIQRLIIENSDLKGEIIRIQNILTRQMGIEAGSGNEKDIEIENLKFKLNEMYERKEFYKKMLNENQTNLDISTKAIEEEQTKLKQINQKLLDDLSFSADKLLEAGQEIRDKDEIYSKYVEKIDKERNRMQETYETISLENNNEITRLKIELSKKEEAKKANRFNNKRMKEVDDELTEAKRKITVQNKMLRAWQKCDR